MSEKVLFVDDDQRILNAISRQFEDKLDFETANGPEAALERLADKTPFAVVVSDMQMPGMNGIEFLARMKETSPDTVRVMLTGHADFHVSVKAINEGNIFRFLSKPCPQNELEKAVRDGLAQYRLVTAERELLEGTLHGSIKVLSEILSLVSPAAFGRTSQVQRIAPAIAEDLQISNAWDLKIATMLFPLGYVSVSETALEHALAGRPIPERDQAVFSQHASVAKNLLEKYRDSKRSRPSLAIRINTSMGQETQRVASRVMRFPSGPESSRSPLILRSPIGNRMTIQWPFRSSASAAANLIHRFLNP